MHPGGAPDGRRDDGEHDPRSIRPCAFGDGQHGQVCRARAEPDLAVPRPRRTRLLGGLAERQHRDVPELRFPVPHRAGAQLPKLRCLLAAGYVVELRARRIDGPVVGQLIQEQHVRRAVGDQMGEYPDQVAAGAAVPEYRHPQRPVALEVEPRGRPGVEELHCVPRHAGLVGVIGDRQDVQAGLPRPGYLLARAARAVGPQLRPQRGVPAHQAAQPGRRILDGDALGQPHPSGHAELAAAGLHIEHDRFLTPGQRFEAGISSGERDDYPFPAQLLEHS